jgi:DNA-binding transcriptional ArsR family regulator
MTTDITAPAPGRALPRWPLILIALPAAVAVWSGWVGLGTLCGFGVVRPLPGIADGFTINTAITLPVGVEAYGAYALGAWLAPGAAPAARTFARRSALGALALGMTGQVIYHLLTAWHAAAAPWPVVMLVSCLPVLTLGFGGALTHLLRTTPAPAADTPQTAPAIAADTRPDSTPDTPAATAADTAPAPQRTPARTRRGPSTAARVAALKDKHPDMTAADIAARLKISDRTVRRHLAAPPATPRQIAA